MTRLRRAWWLRKRKVPEKNDWGQTLGCRGDDTEVQAEIQRTKRVVLEVGFLGGMCRGCTSSFFGCFRRSAGMNESTRAGSCALEGEGENVEALAFWRHRWGKR